MDEVTTITNLITYQTPQFDYLTARFMCNLGNVSKIYRQ